MPKEIFWFKLNSKDFLVKVLTMPEDERSSFLYQMALDLAANKSEDEFVKTMIDEAQAFAEKKSSAAKKRWSADAVHMHCTSTGDAVHMQNDKMHMPEQNRTEQNRTSINEKNCSLLSIVPEKKGPTLSEVLNYSLLEKKFYHFDAIDFFHKNEAKDWVGIKNWKTTLINWAGQPWAKGYKRPSLKALQDFLGSLPTKSARDILIEVKRGMSE